MKTAADKSITTTATRSEHHSQPFFAKAGGGDFFAPAVQAKLTVGKEGDKFEQEADMMADKAVQRAAMPNVQAKCADCDEKDKLQRKPLADGITPFIQRKEIEEEKVQRKEEEEEPVQAKRIQRKEKEAEEPVQAKRLQRKEEEQEEPVQAKRIQRMEKEEEEPIQAKSATGQARPSMTAVEWVLQDTKGLGSRLPDPVRQEMEAGFGVDMSEVRIHTDQAAVDMSQSLSAQAFTHGWDVFFNQHKYNPNTRDGKLLLAHELAHTLQQAKSNGESLRPAQTREEVEIPIVPNEEAAMKAAMQEAEEAALDIAEEQAAEASAEQAPLPDAGQNAPKKPAPNPNPTLPPCPPAPAAKANAKGTAPTGAQPSVAPQTATPPAAPAAETPALAPSPAPQGGDKAAPAQAAEPTATIPAPQGGDKATPAQAAGPAQAPKCPANDPDFKKAKGQIGRDAEKQRSHEPAEQKRDEMVASSALPMAEQSIQSGQDQKAEQLETAAVPPQRFDRNEFKRKLKEKIESKMPENEDQAKEFSKNSKLDEAKEEFKGTIGEEKNKVSGPLDAKKDEPLPPGQDLKPDNMAVPDAKPGDKPATVPTGLAAPKPRTDAEISLDHKSVELDEQVAKEGLTEPQMAEWEETEEPKPLTAKKDAQREIAAAPGQYRQMEGQELEQSKKQADKATGKELKQMANAKTGKNKEVQGGQTAKETKTEAKQREIKEKIDGIYKATEVEVTNILSALATSVETYFSTMVEIANTIFKDNVRSRLDDHYGWFTFDDKIAEWAGLSDGVAHIFREEKQRFLDYMDAVLEYIATYVETELNRALDRIKLGRTQLEDFKKTLSGDELKFADELFLEANEKFAELETSVNESQEELIDTLSDAYVESVNKLQEDFDKINEELSASWIADAFSFIGEVATAIKKLGELLSSIASRIGQYISDILASPKRFFNNLVDGITGGMDEFSNNIDTYMEQGFWMWLTGASSAAKIEIPKTMNVEGMFSLAAQILGITKDFILMRIQKVLRIPIDTFLAFMEKADSVAMKFMEPVKILFTQGIGALWTWVKGEISSKLDEIFGGLKTEIFQAIIKKFLLWVASLFIPGLGFIKLIQAAYKALRWFVDNIDRIIEIVNAFLDAVGLAVAGNVSAIKQKIVKALTMGVVIAIDFLAKLVGLGNFSAKLKKGIEKLQKPVHGAIDFVLKKARPFVNKIKRAVEKGVKAVKKGVKGVKEKGKAAVGKILAWWKAKKSFKDTTGASHEIYFAGNAKSAKLMVASTDPKQVKKFLENIKGSVPKGKTKTWNNASKLNEKISGLQGDLEKNNTNPSGKKVQANQKDFESLKKELETLAGLLSQLMGLTKSEEPPPPILPPFSNNVRASSVEASYLTASANFPQGEKETGNVVGLGGWKELQDSENNVRERDNFVKMHLLHHQLGGKAMHSNLTPAKSNINSDYYHELEKPALNDSGLISGRKKPSNKVIWYNVKVRYHGGKEFDKQFIKSIQAKYGHHEADNNWAKGPEIKSWSAYPGVPDLESKIFAINEDGSTVLAKMKYKGKFSDEFIQLVVLEKKISFKKGTKEKYETSSDLKKRLLHRVEDENGWNKTKMKKETDRLKEAIDDQNVNIKLYGSD